MPVYLMSAQVRNLLGPDGVARAAVLPPAKADCMVCGSPLGADGTTNVLLARADSAVFLRYAHPGCADSQLVDLPPGLAADMAEGLADEGVRLRMTAALVEHGSAVLPCLVAEPADAVCTVSGGETVDLTTSRLLARGWTLVSQLRQPPRRLPDWTANIDLGPSAPPLLALLDPRDASPYRGPVELPPGWLTAATRRGSCVAYVGPAGMTRPHGEQPPARLQAALRTAASLGHLVGGRIPLTVTGREPVVR